MIRTPASAAMARELQARLPSAPTQPFHVVIENDLLGRAALAILWQYRNDMILYLLSDHPPQDHIAALLSGIETVRAAPKIQILSSRAAIALAQGAGNLVWAVDMSRTAAAAVEILSERNAETTWLPFFEAFEALEHKYAKHTRHELALRDIICEHARFLNFFGDRFNPKDLYQRAKYPSWFRPPEDVSAAIPTVQQTTSVNGHVLDRTEFTGTLQLPADQPLSDCSAVVELGPIFQALETSKYDAVLTVRHFRGDLPVRGACMVQVHRGKDLVASVDVGTDCVEVEVPLPVVTAATELSVSLTAQSEDPSAVGTDTNAAYINLAILPRGTYWRARYILKTWVQRLRRRFGVWRD